MFKLKISPEFLQLKDWVEKIPESFDEIGEIVQAKKNRNILKKVEFEGQEFNIKSFHVPRFFNRVVYTFFRKSKALRSFEHARILLEKGIGTPEPVALLQETRGGLIGRSYYICRQLPEDYQEIRYCYWGPLLGHEETLVAFAQFTARLHEAGVYHTDYSPGNILWKRMADKSFDFQLVDINRMKFSRVSMDMGCRNFARLFECDEIYRFVAKEYAKSRGFNAEIAESLIMKYQREFNKKKSHKKKIKILLSKK